MSATADVIKCAKCGTELGKTDFKIKSLFLTNQLVCEECALLEDEQWLNDQSQTLVTEYQ